MTRTLIDAWLPGVRPGVDETDGPRTTASGAGPAPARDAGIDAAPEHPLLAALNIFAPAVTCAGEDEEGAAADGAGPAPSAPVVRRFARLGPA
ncbi:hypothetical protein AB0P32_31325 [Streptomyces sp. NPDC085995]|uniref:hypothetical protein n=1 Tax=Streptomyces sp. NPDC085995 TaxID=3154861 RepID=UPI00342E4AE7